MSSEVAEREIVELGDENDLEMIEDKNIGKKQAEGKKELVKSDSGEQTKQKLCKCNKCDLSSIMLLFYNVNCQHILCVKCLQLLGHVSQLKCDTVMKNDAKCDALWTRKSTHILTYVDPLFMNVLSVKLESNASLNVDKSDTNVEVCLDTAALKFLRCIKPCIPGLPTLDTSAVLTAKTDNPTTAEPGQNEIMAIDSPPRKRPKRSDSAQKSDESSAAPRKSSTTRSKPAEPKVTSERKSPENKPKANPEHKSPDKKPNPAVEVSKADEKPDLATVVENPLLKRPLSSVENKEKSGEGKIKLNAANDPATYKKVMKKNFKGETQLHSACQKGLLEKAREWLEMGSDPNTSDNANLRPIHEHGVIHNPDLCKLLLEYGAEMNVAGGEENLMPLHIAISNNCVETAKLLIKFGADLNATGKDQAGVEFTAMSLAEKMAKEYGCGDLLAAVKETKREVFEPVKPPTILCGPPPKLGKPIVFSVSGLTDEEKDLVAKFAEKFHERVTLSQNYNNDCNVLICGKSKTKTNSYPPSIKILAAILTNGLVVDVAWMRESINNRTFLNYETYMMDSICGLKGGIARARESSKTTSKKLFYGLKFYVSQKLQTFKFHEICLLIEIGDGQILAEAPDPSVGKKLLDDSKIKIEFMKEDSMICDMRLVYVTEDIFGHIEKLKDGAYKVSPDWIVNCVASYSLPSNVFPHCSSTDSANKPLQW